MVALCVLLPLPRVATPAPVAPVPLTATTTYSLDSVSIGGAPIVLRWHPQPRIAPDPAEAIVFSGWAEDDAARAPVREVLAVVDGGPTYAAVTGLVRDDVAATYHDPARASSGFRLTIPPCSLSAGHHRIAFRFEANDRHGYYRSGDDVDIDVTAPRRIDRIAYSVDVLAPPMSRYGAHVMKGWLVRAGTCAPARDVGIRIDGRATGTVRYGIPRPDVAKSLGVPAYARSGFVAAWTDSPLPPGSHTLQLVARAGSGRELASGYVVHFAR